MGSKFSNARKLIIGIGIVFAIVTLGSGLSGWVFESSQVDHSPQDPRGVRAASPPPS